MPNANERFACNGGRTVVSREIEIGALEPQQVGKTGLQLELPRLLTPDLPYSKTSVLCVVLSCRYPLSELEKRAPVLLKSEFSRLVTRLRASGKKKRGGTRTPVLEWCPPVLGFGAPVTPISGHRVYCSAPAIRRPLPWGLERS